MIDARQPPTALRAARVGRWPSLLLLAAALAAATISYRLLDSGPPTVATPAFLEHALGAPRAQAPLVRRPRAGVAVNLRRDGFGVVRNGRTVLLTSAPRSDWSRFAGGVHRRTGFGGETITVTPERTEEFLTVSHRQGARTWRWRLRGTGLEPRLDRSGAVSLSAPGADRPLQIPPARILDTRGADRTPAGLRWTLRRAGAHGWWLELRLDDRRLPLPYVIDPAVDYPSPLYLSSTASTSTGSWRLVGTAPSAANSATTTTPAANTTGYFLFKPGVANTTAATPSGSPSGAAFIQDLAGGTGFPAGTWSFSIKTQVAGTTLVSGSAILAIGVWKGTIIGSGTFKSSQTILAPTDDPAAQNIRASLSPITTTVAYSLPAFTLANNERLYVEVWRKQVGGINSATATDRQVNLIVNDGISRVVHPAADSTAPTNAFGVSGASGGVYLANPGGATGTVYYRGSAAGSFSLQDAATDTGSGVKQVSYPAVTTAGWTHAAQTVTTAPNYQSSTYSWTAGATTSPGAQAIVAQDNALNSTSGSPITITNDTTAPTAPSVVLTSPPAWYTTPSVALTPTDGTDSGSGVDPTSRIYQRDEATMTNGACNAFPGTWTQVVQNPDTTVQNGKCYRYRLLESDRVGNQSAPSAASGTANVDLQPPTQPSLAFSALSNAFAAGSTVYYRAGSSGSFTATASAADAESGVAGYVFPTPSTWTVTGTGAARTYAWSGTPTPPGPLGVHATDVASNTGPDATFTPTPDSTPPTTGDNSAAVGSGWTQTAQTVTLSPSDDLSGVGATYSTTDGSTPTTSSPSGTSVQLTSDGVYTVKYFSVDRVGNAEPIETAATTIRIDRTPGTATLGGLPGFISNGQVLTATASDATSGVASVGYLYCSPSPCTPTTPIGSSTSGPTYPVTWNAEPADGTYDIAAQVTDSAGNTAVSSKATVVVDNTPPDTTITSQPSDPSGPSASFSFTSSESGSTFQCSLDAAPYAACVAPVALSGLAGGTHTFSVRAIDAAGNTDPTPAADSWTVATSAPDTTITANPPDPSNNPSPSFSFASTIPGSTFQCSLDGAAYADCSTPDTLSGLADGTHTFGVAATAAGSTDPTPATYAWTVDTVPPDTSIASKPTDPSNDSAPSFAFTSTETPSTFRCSIDGGAFTTCTSPQAYALADGTHTFAVQATDAAGNTDPAPATYSWTINTTSGSSTVDEVHYNYLGPTSVSFDWRGEPTDIRYGLTSAYGSTATASAPTPLPFSSAGPFRQVDLTGLASGTTYHYSIGGGADHTFSTPPTGNFRFDVVADVGSTLLSSKVATVAGQVAGDTPSFVLVPGDLTYANGTGQGQPAVDQHFNDVMAWSQNDAYMPSWGNHEWETPTLDDLRNYKGRFKLPNAQAVPSAPPEGCCGNDWGWFDAGGVRFIAYPELYHTSTVSEWQTQVDPVFAAAQADPNIHFIVTYGHEPAYSTGLHAPNTNLANALNSFGDRYSKYVLNINGHNHDYERFQPIHGVTHITTGAATNLETPWVTTDSRLVFRAFHLEHLRVDVSSDGIRVDAICGPSTSTEDTTCSQGTVLDTTTIGVAPPPPPPAPVLYVDNQNPVCSDTGLGTQDQPFCTISAAASRVNPGQTVQVASGTYPESVTVPTSATQTAPIVFTAAPGASVLLTGGTTGFSISNKSFITINGFSVTSTSGVGISVQNSSNVTITNDHVSYAGQPVSGQTKSGIYLNTVRDSTVSGNTVDHNTSYGIYLNGSSRNLISGNESFSNAQQFARAASGIRLYNSTDNTVDSNRTHNNEDSGIESFNGANNNLIVDNVSYDNGDHGIDNFGSTGQRIFGNTAYHNVTAGINIEGGSTGATIANNISVDNGINSPRTHSDIRVENTAVTGTTMDYDLVNLSSPDTLLIWNSVNYTSLAAFQAATGQELHGVQADPKWANIGARDFHLTVGSPALDSANSGVSGQPSVDLEGNPRVDDPRTRDTGVGPRSYDDRGAFELQAPQLDHIVVTPATATIQAGASQTYAVQGFDAAGNSLGDVTSSTTFSISPDGLCTGSVCTATIAGPHTVTANDPTTGGATKTATATLTVTAAALDHLALSPAVATVVSGTRQAYSVDGRDVYNNSLGDVTAATSFSIAPNGSCTSAGCRATAAGPHTVTATDAGKTGTASLQVVASALDHILISPANASIAAGGSQSYTAQGFDSSGNSLGDVTAGTVFSIAPDGSCTGNVCTAAVSGTHTVTGNNSGKTSTGSVTVTAGSLDHLALSPSPATMSAGSSQTFAAQGRDQFDNSLGDATAGATFSIQPDGSCNGNVCTASTSGPHTVTATKSGTSGTASLQVDAAALDHLVLSPSSSSVSVGNSQPYAIEGRDVYGNSTGDVTASATLSIAPDGSCSGDACTPSAAGAHTVTATVGGATGTASLQAVTVDQIVISPSDATIQAGQSATFTVEGFDAAGNSLGDVTSTTTFSIDPDGSCTLNVCTATEAWPHTVTAVNGGATATASIFVTPAAIDHLVVSTDTPSITAGTSATFEADGNDRYGNSTGDVTSGTTFSISPDGSCSGATCTATAAGPHTVTATNGGATGTYSLGVTAAALDHLVLTPASATVSAGGSQTYTADAKDAYGNSLGDVTSSATFSIDPEGSCVLNQCTASAAGPHTVTATFLGATGTASLNVVGGAVDHIAISPSSAAIGAGGTQAYSAEAFDASGNSLGDVTPSASFTIAPDGSCTGNVCTATTAGAHTVTANAAGKTDTGSLTVNAAPLDHLTLAPASSTIGSGGSQTYTAQGRDQYGNSLGDLTSSTTFTIAPNGSCTGATCTASISGAHTVTGTSSGKTGTASLTVASGTLDHIVVGPSSATITAGGSQSFTAQGFDSSGNSLGDVTAATTFTIAPDGSCTGNTCTATTAGVHTVTGNDSGKTATATLTVNPGSLDHLALSPASASITAGGSQTYTAQGRDRFDNSLGDVTASTTFTISPNGSCNGAACTASVAGAHTVTGTKSGKTGTASLQVNAGPLDHIVISPSTATITAGGSKTYTAQAFDASNNSLGDVTASTTFTILPDGSCSTNVCTTTVSGTHTVTGNDGGKTSSASLTVNPGPLDHLVLSPASATITAGGSQGYTAQARDQYNNSLGDATANTTFSISPNGSCAAAVCTASAAGAHVVTGTFLGATGTASLQVGTGTLDHIVISPANATVVAGTSQTYGAQGFDSFNNSLGDVTSVTAFSIAPDGSCSGNVCTPAAGGSHTVTGTDAGKTSLATLNADFVKNGGFETDLTGWNTSGSGTGVTLARVSGGHSGGFSAQITNTSSTNQTCLLNDSPNWGKTTAAGTYTATLWARADRSVPLKLRLREYTADNVTLLGTNTTQLTLGGSWQQISVSYTITSPGSTLDLNAYLASADGAPGTCFYADDVSLVRGVPLDHISLSPASATIPAGNLQAYSAQGFDAAGNSLGDVTGQTTFTIAPDGSCSGNVCTASTPGTHTVTGNDGGKTATATLQVTTGALDHLLLSPASASITAGGSQTYTATGYDAAGNSLGDVTAATTFTITPNGSCTGNTCTATTAGAHTVTATDSGKSGTASLTVNPAVLDHLALSPSSATITAGGAQTYSAEGRDQYGNSLGDVTANTTFTIAPDGSCSGSTCVATAAGAHTVTGTDAGKTGTASLTVTPAALDHLALSPSSATIAAGASQTYTVQGRDQYDNSLGDMTSSTTFSIAPDGSCSGNVCTATRAGTHTVTGARSGKTGTASLEVAAASLDHLVLSPATASIPAGGTQGYTAEGRDRYGNSLGDVTASTTFTIAPDGSCAAAVCTASTAGVHTVTGTSLGAVGTASLTVTASSLDHISLSPASATIPAGNLQAYSAQGFDAAGNSLGDVTGQTTFTIAPDGSCSGNVCTASTPGTHTVTGNDGGKTATATLQVTTGALDHLLLSPASASITAGGSQTYTATGYDAAGNSLGDVTAATTFTIAPNGSCTGNTCTATTAGTHTVTGTSSGKTGTASLTVGAGSADHIVITPSSASIAAGGAQSYAAKSVDSSGNVIGDVTASTTFSITPDGSCGGNTCTATAAGNHTVTGDDAGQTATATLTVTAASLASLTISPASATIGAGGTQTYTAQGRDQYGNSLGDVTSSTTFSIAPDGSCTGATCTALNLGPHTVTGTNAGKTDTASLQVTSGSLDHIVISPASATITAGGSQSYTAQGFDAGGNSLGDVTAATTFTIAPDGSCTGNTCTATTAGAHTVTGNDGGKTATASLQVGAGTLDHLSLSPASASIAAGGSQSYTAQGRDQYGNPLGDLTASTSFTIAPNGSCAATVCTATAAGAHTVTGAAPGATGTASLQVNPAALDHITIAPGSARIQSGGSQSYTATGFDTYNNTIGNVTAATTFSIAPDGSCSGNSCTAVNGGAHTVTGTDSGKTSSASLNVNFVRNSGFETDLSGWNTSGSGTGITLSRVSGGHSGAWAAQLTNTSSGNQSCVLNDSPNWARTTVAGTYSASIWVRADRSGAPLKLRLREYTPDNVTLLGTATSQVTLSGSWQQVTVTYTITSPGSTLDLNAYLATADGAPGTCFYADDVELYNG